MTCERGESSPAPWLSNTNHRVSTATLHHNLDETHTCEVSPIKCFAYIEGFLLGILWRLIDEALQHEVSRYYCAAFHLKGEEPRLAKSFTIAHVCVHI